jgi:hypothetical protein
MRAGLSSAVLINRKARSGKVSQKAVSGVFFGKHRELHRPVDIQVRIRPKNAGFTFRCVRFAAFIMDQCFFAENTKPVRESFGNIQLVLVLIRQDGTRPLTKMGRAATNVHDHVKDLPFQCLYEFGLGTGILEVETPESASNRKRHVVLHKRTINSAVFVPYMMVGLHEEAALVGVDIGRDLYDSGKFCRDDVHFQSPNAGC